MVQLPNVQNILLHNKIGDNMTKINEILTSIILYSLISYILQLPYFYYGLLFTIIGTQINLALPKNYKHTILLYIPLLIFTTNYPIITVPLMTGYTSSIFISLLSKNGCKLLYPLKNNTFTGPANYLENDTKKDYAATTFLLVLMIVTVALSTNGCEIIDTISQENDLSNYINSNNTTDNNHSTDYIQYINIDAEKCWNMNITTTTNNNTTTTIIKEYNNQTGS